MLLLQFINVCKAPNFQQSVVLSHLLLAIGAAVAKIYSLKCNSKRIICLLERLDGRNNIDQLEIDNKIYLLDAMRHIKIVSTIAFVFIITFSVFLNLRSIWSQSELSFDCWYPFDISSKFWFHVAYFHQICLFLFGAVIVSVDTFVTGLIYFAANKIRILNCEFRRLYENDDCLVEWIEPGSVRRGLVGRRCCVVSKRLRAAAAYHVNVMKLTRDLATTFNAVVNVQVCTAALGICVTAYNILISLNSVNLTLMCAFLTFNVLQLFFYCHYGNVLSEEITKAAYNAFAILRDSDA